MKKFRKKPILIEVEALQWQGDLSALRSFIDKTKKSLGPTWTGTVSIDFDDPESITLSTRCRTVGLGVVSPGDWLVCDANNAELFALSNETFEDLYEDVSSQ